MSRSVKGAKGPGYEYWSRRAPNKIARLKPGREAKKITHQIERRQAKDQLASFVKEDL